MLQDYLWFIYSLTAAVLWGVHYATAGELSKTIPPFLISLAYLVFVGLIAVLFVFVFFPSTFKFHNLLSYLTFTTVGQMGLMALTGCISNFLVFSAIADSTATKASIIEITYPFFVPLFAMILYGENELNLQTGIGSLLIIVGVIFVIKS